MRRGDGARLHRAPAARTQSLPPRRPTAGGDRPARRAARPSLSRLPVHATGPVRRAVGVALATIADARMRGGRQRPRRHARRTARRHLRRQPRPGALRRTPASSATPSPTARKRPAAARAAPDSNSTAPAYRPPSSPSAPRKPPRASPAPSPVSAWRCGCHPRNNYRPAFGVCAARSRQPEPAAQTSRSVPFCSARRPHGGPPTQKRGRRAAVEAKGTARSSKLRRGPQRRVASDSAARMARPAARLAPRRLKSRVRVSSGTCWTTIRSGSRPRAQPWGPSRPGAPSR